MTGKTLNFASPPSRIKLRSEAESKDISVGELLRGVVATHLKRRRK